MVLQADVHRAKPDFLTLGKLVEPVIEYLMFWLCLQVMFTAAYVTVNLAVLCVESFVSKSDSECALNGLQSNVELEKLQLGSLLPLCLIDKVLAKGTMRLFRVTDHCEGLAE